MSAAAGLFVRDGGIRGMEHHAAGQRISVGLPGGAIRPRATLDRTGGRPALSGIAE